MQIEKPEDYVDPPRSLGGHSTILMQKKEEPYEIFENQEALNKKKIESSKINLDPNLKEKEGTIFTVNDFNEFTKNLDLMENIIIENMNENLKNESNEASKRVIE